MMNLQSSRTTSGGFLCEIRGDGRQLNKIYAKGGEVLGAKSGGMVIIKQS